MTASPSAAIDTPSLRLSVLDVGSFPLCLELAPRVEELGYHRYWLSEHHGEGAMSNPTLLLPLVAGSTTRIRVGTAGILLRFQSPLAVAENFRLLQHAFSDRIDLGVASAPTASGWQTRLLYDGRPESYSAVDHRSKLSALQRILAGRDEAGVTLVSDDVDPPLTAAGAPPIWVMSTSLSGATTAAAAGCRYSFHEYYDPPTGPHAVARYIAEFLPSPELARPEWNVCVSGFCVENESEIESIRARYNPAAGRVPIVGTRDLWARELVRIRDSYRTNEIVVQTLWGQYPLGEQVASFERLAALASAV